MLLELVRDLSIGIDAIVFDKVAPRPVTKHANLDVIALVIGTVPSRILEESKGQRAEYVNALAEDRTHDLGVIQHFVKVTPEAIRAGGLILEFCSLHRRAVEVITYDTLDCGGDNFKVSAAGFLVSSHLEYCRTGHADVGRGLAIDAGYGG